MKYRNNFAVLKSIFQFFMLAAIVFFMGSRNSMVPVDNFGGGEFIFENTECITDEQRQVIWEDINRNTEMLRRQGKIHDNPSAIVQLEWPLKKAAGFNDPGYYGIANYVDHDNGSGLRDYNCGARTYNSHRGVDIYLWPFRWYKMDNNQVEVIAGAPGVITLKRDGEFDRSCTFNSNTWNAVYVRHADGSIAWYGHLKKNSVTSKSVGDSVALGEYLGVVGSSGNSSGPHLHFELYNNTYQLQDPWQGTCNNLNGTSWWANQKPYFEPKINALKTHSMPPVFPTCPAQEIPNFKTSFNPGDSIYFIPYYADQMAGLMTQYTVFKPDSSIWYSWSHSSPQSYPSSYWYWSNTIPPMAPHGTYTFQAEFNSQTYKTTFTVGTTGIQNVSTEVPDKYELLQNYPNPFNPETKIKFALPSSGNVKLEVYDITGRLVNTLVNEVLRSGTYEFKFNGTNIPSGVYYYKLQAGDFVQVKKMVIVK